MLVLYVMLVANLTILALATIVAFSGIKKIQKKLLFLFLLFVIPWAVGDILMLYAESGNLIAVGKFLFLIAPMFTTLFILLFSFASPRGEISNKLIWRFSAVSVGSALAVYIFMDSILERIVVMGQGRNLIYIDHTGYALYALYFLLYFGISYLVLYKRIRKNERADRIQLQYSFIGIVVSSSLALATNLALPVLYNVTDLIWMGPIFSVFFAYLSVVAIVRHKYLDIRFIVARSVAYALLLVTLGLIYGVMIFGIGSIFYAEQVQSFPFQLRAIYVILAVFLAFSFQPLKKFFDKITNEIFYRDGYSSQERLKLLGEILAEEIDIDIVTNRVVELIAATLKPTATRLIVMEKGRIYTDRSKGKSISVSVKSLEKLKNVISVREDESQNKDLLVSKDIDLVARIETQGTVVGYILLGPKASGSIYTGQDVEFLSIAIKELAVGLENAKNFAQIQQFNETLKKKVKNATNNLRQKNAKLRELDQAKDDFISMASHQLRTPLTTVKGYLSMLNDGDFGDLNKKQHEVTGLAYASAERMVYLIGDLLNVSRIDTGKFVIEPTRVDLASMVKEEVNQLQRSAKAKDLKLNIKAPKNFPKVMLDETKTRQVIMNFIDNAIYYTLQGEVNVELKKTKDSIEFMVHDTGIGVPEKAKADLFTKFFRAENARKARPDGTGLGLFMAKKVITGQGGSIIFRSKESKGSTFGFRFSLAAVGAKK